MAEHHQHALPNGYKLGRYSIEAVLGAGGFAITYLAQHTGLDQKVAIKEYLPDEFGIRIEGKTTVRAKRGEEDEFAWGLERFADEARTLAKFNHTSIVPVTDIFEANGTAYMVMPYQEGESLEERLGRDGTLPEPVLRKLFDPLIDALALVHASDILHRDIKPANIFIRTDGTPVLLDFGNARQALGTKSQSLTATLTPGYAPNEQYTSRGKQGAWTDVYSLGATLYKAAVGEMPPEAPERATEDSYVPAATAAKGKYAPALLAAIDKSLTFNPGDRPQDMAAFKQLLDQSENADETAAPAKQEAASATLLPRESEPLLNPSQQILELREVAVSGTDRVLWGLQVAILIVATGIAVWVYRAEISAFFGWGSGTTVSSKSSGAKTQPATGTQSASRARREAEIAEAKRRAEAVERAKRKAAAVSAAQAKARAHLQKGGGLLKLGQYKRAIVELDKAIRLNPKSAVAYIKRGSAYYWLQWYPRAIRDYDEAIRLSPKSARYYLFRGNAYLDWKQYRSAIKDYDVVIRSFPRSANAYSSRGWAYHGLGQTTKAISNLRIALLIDPSNKLARQRLMVTFRKAEDARRKAAEARRRALSRAKTQRRRSLARTSKLTRSELDALRRQLERCWNFPAGARNTKDMVVEIRVLINRDRTVRQARIVDVARMRRDPFYRSAAESARRAVLNPRCSPLKLPPAKYDLWRSMTLRFDPREAFGG